MGRAASKMAYGCFECVPRHGIKVDLALQKGEAEFVWEEVGDFHDLGWLFGTQPLITEGEPTVPGATRTFRTGGVETLLSFSEEKRRLTWSLNRFPDYEGGMQVKEDKVHFWINAKAPKMILEMARSTATEQLNAVLYQVRQRVQLSKSCITINTVPLKDLDGYENVVRSKELPEIKKLMTQGDLYQFQLGLDRATSTVRAVEVWKDCDTHARIFTESFFEREVMSLIRPFVDLSRVKGDEINAWGDLHGRFADFTKSTPKVLHSNENLDLFLFRSLSDNNFDNIIVTDNFKLKSDTAAEYKRLLKELEPIARGHLRKGEVNDVRFHLNTETNMLHRFIVYDGPEDFEKLVMNKSSPFGALISQIEGLAAEGRAGTVFGTDSDKCPARVRDHFDGSGLVVSNFGLANEVSRHADASDVKIADQIGSYSKEQQAQCHDLLKELDSYTSTMLDLLPKRTWDLKKTLRVEPYVVEEPSLKSTGQDTVKMGKLEFGVQKSDDYFGAQTFVDRLVFGTMSNGMLFPIDDKLNLDIPDDLVDCMKHELLFDKIIPRPHHNFTELESDAALERAILSGVFSLWLKEHEDGFKCDYSQMGQLKAREGFRDLGATAYLNAERKLTSIYVCDLDQTFKPGQAGWDDAKMMFKVSAAQWNTANDHLCGVHMVATNPVVNSAVKCLPLEHTIRRLVQPFCFRSVYVNMRATKSLLDPHSIVMHACGYDVQNFEKLLEMGATTSDLWLSPPERIAKAGKKVQELVDAKQFPYGEDSIRLWNAFKAFVSDWLDKAYENDDAIKGDKDLQAFAEDLHNQTKDCGSCTPKAFCSKEDVAKCLATFMSNATGMHEYVGTVQEYIGHPQFMGFRLRTGSKRIDMQTWLLGMLLFSVTSLPMPMLMDDHKGTYTKEWEQNCWQGCLARLRQVGAEISADNKSPRPYPYHSFHPDVLECSVNV